jgi:hypothetical protein
MGQVGQEVNDLERVLAGVELGPLEAEKARREAALIREAELRERMVAALERIATAMEAAE